MGKPQQRETGRPGSASTAASVHSLQLLDDHDDLDLPPSYTEATPESISTHQQQQQQTPPPVNQAQALSARLSNGDYAIPGSRNACSVFAGVRNAKIVTVQRELSQKPHELYHTIAQQINLPPRPQLIIHGSHTESSRASGNDKKSASTNVVDFNFRLDLAETLLTGWENARTGLFTVSPGSVGWHVVRVVPGQGEQKEYRGGRWKSTAWKPPKATRIALGAAEEGDVENHDPYTDGVEAEGDRLLSQHSPVGLVQGDRRFQRTEDAASFERWCKRFCEDPAAVKSFTLTRTFHGFDAEALGSALTSHIRDLNYRGHLHTKMALANGSITVYSPHWINHLRINPFVFWICILTQLWIITWPVLWLLEHRYEAIFSEWHASRVHYDGETRLKFYARGRDEADLATFWAPVVKQAAWTRRCGNEVLLLDDAYRLQGMTTEQVLSQSADSDAERERRVRVDRGEGSFVDSMVGLARGASEIGQSWNRSMGWGGDC